VYNPVAHSSDNYGFGASEVDGIWQPAVELQMAFGSIGFGPDPVFGGISCPGTGDCTAAGYYYDASGYQQGFVIDGTSGSPTTPPTGTKTNPAPTTPAPTPPHPKLGMPHISGFSVLLPVSCSGTGTCSLALTLTATGTPHSSKLLASTAGSRKPKPHQTVVGATSLSVPGQGTVTAKVALNKLGKRLLKQHQTLPVTLTVKQAGTVLTSQRLKFKRH
jgi:hypothetical protein